ncbi:MAG: hypothetical protein EOP20_13820, partial [Hyphomicrobiales bacterium]
MTSAISGRTWQGLTITVATQPKADFSCTDPHPLSCGPGMLDCVAWQVMAEPSQVAAWDTLTDRASEPNPFYESWYLLPSLRNLSADGDIRFLRFELGGRLAGLLPVVRPSRYYRYPFPHLANWLHPNMFCGAPLVAQGCEVAFWQAMLRWVDRESGAALFLHLRDLPLGGMKHPA